MIIIGLRGHVGARIMAALPTAIPALSLRTADEETVKRLIDTVDPDAVIHTSAMSDIPTCEKDPDNMRQLAFERLERRHEFIRNR
ncbi:MAG: sugar nucleotide-binding protein [Clostridia bacterium]|nr:sugar nucleotide-binding protein [Clostridia bacterium]